MAIVASIGATNAPVALIDVAPPKSIAAIAYRRRNAWWEPVNVRHAYKGSVYGVTSTAGVGANRYSTVVRYAVRLSDMYAVNLRSSVWHLHIQSGLDLLVQRSSPPSGKQDHHHPTTREYSAGEISIPNCDPPDPPCQV